MSSDGSETVSSPITNDDLVKLVELQTVGTQGDSAFVRRYEAAEPTIQALQARYIAIKGREKARNIVMSVIGHFAERYPMAWAWAKRLGLIGAGAGVLEGGYSFDSIRQMLINLIGVSL